VCTVHRKLQCNILCTVHTLLKIRTKRGASCNTPYLSKPARPAQPVSFPLLLRTPFSTPDTLNAVSRSSPQSLQGHDSSVGIATRYGQNGSGSSPDAGVDIFCSCPDRPWGPPATYTMGTRSFEEVKRPGRGVDHHLALRLKKE
jgi:hypothetical protein